MEIGIQVATQSITTAKKVQSSATLMEVGIQVATDQSITTPQKVQCSATMEIGIQVVTQSTTGQEEFVVNILGDRFAVNTVFASSDSDVKRWVQQIQKTHRQKLRRRKLIVALNADRSFNYANGSRSYSYKPGKSQKDEPYELLEICVENDVLLCSLNANACNWGEKWFPKALKDFLNDNGVTVVGVGIESFAKKMEKDYGWIMTNKVVELRDLAAQKLEPTKKEEEETTTAARDFSRFGLAKLARAVLGDEVDFAKPKKITWWDPQRYRWHGERLTVDMIKYATVEVFLARLMGATLLRQESCPLLSPS